jgi:hypothetical protein
LCRSFLGLLGWVLAALSPATRADITGFSNGTNWTANNNGTGGPSFTSTTLTLTDGGANEARSAYYDTPQLIARFSASFIYQATNPVNGGVADGVAFVLQNQGLNALGAIGGSLGVSGISPSAEVELNVFDGHTIGTNFEVNGANSQNYLSTSPVDLASGDPIQVTLAYDGTVLTETLTNLSTHQTYQTTFQTDLSALLGSTALVGFTGASGGRSSTQTISSFSYASSVPEPESLVLLGVGLAAVASYQRRRSRRSAS